MKTKILFEVMIADGFTYPPDDGKTNLHLWPISVGRSQELDIELEINPRGGELMKEAEEDLDNYMKKNYPDKEYKIYYWWWK